MSDDSLLPFDLPSIQRKKVSAAFDGGLISSDGGLISSDGVLVLLREAERSLGLAETLAGCIRDRRNQVQVVHSLSAMLRFRIHFSSACPDASLFRLLAGRLAAAGSCPKSLLSALGPARPETVTAGGSIPVHW